MIIPQRMGFDLGSSTVQVAIKGKGIVLEEPSVVAFYRNEGKVLAVGLAAVDMLGKTPPHIQAAYPIRHGMVVNLPVTEAMLRYFLRRVGWYYRPSLVISVPANITNVARRAVREAALAAGASKVWLIESPLAAALGSKLDMRDPAGILVIDMGSGTTDMAVLSAGTPIISSSVRVAGNQFNTAIQDMMRYRHKLLVSPRLAEEIKISLGSATPPTQTESLTVCGSDLVDGKLRNQNVTNQEVYQALAEPIQTLLEHCKQLLSQTPPTLAADLVTRGIVLCGGGAQLDNMQVFLQNQLQIPVCLADNPQQCVALGTMLADPESLEEDR